MTRERPRVDAGLGSLLERGRILRPVPDLVRARALARARATVAAAAASPTDAAPPSPARVYRLRFAFAASLALAAGAAGAAIALVNGALHAPGPAPVASPRTVAPVGSPAIDLATTPGPAPAPPATVASSAAVAKRQRPARPLTPRESYAAELELLQRAQAAYVGRSFSNALAVVAEHGRRFPNGRLAEEREALRVRSLAASGRTEEARRAAMTFVDRFPHSVLLPRLQQTATGQE
jgi:hypothetical protein